MDPVAAEEALLGGRGAVWLARDVVRVAGADAVSFLQGQLSQDVDALAEGGSALSLVLQPTGKVDALVRVTRTGPDELLLDTDGGFGEALVARLQKYKLRTKADFEPLPDWRCLRVLGDVSGSLGLIGPSGPNARQLPTCWPTLAGVDRLGPDPVVPDGFVLCPAGAYEVVRILAGVPAMGAELDERTIPAETEIVDLTVSFTKGCYTGQELVARIDSRGGHVPRHLRRLLAEPGPLPPPGATVEVGGRSVGAVTSSAMSATRGAAVALGYVHRAAAGDPAAGDATAEVAAVLRWDGGEVAATVALLVAPRP
jgi:folate-binding protein YgfZ